MLARLPAYLAARALLFEGPPGSGGSLRDLGKMLVRNAGLALGEWMGPAARRAAAALEGYTGPWHPCAIDGRLDLHEWLCLPDGRVLKADGLDHHAAHDLVGCQDIAWDVAGSVVELGLSRAETAGLTAALEQAGVPPCGDALLHPLTACYAAFRLGADTMAVDALGHDPAEQSRLRTRAAGYAAALRHALANEEP